MNDWKKCPLVSGGLAVLNVLIFVICLFDGGRLYQAGSLDPRAILLGKEYGRILFSMFLHADTMHLFNNMVLLFFLGTMIEKEVGHLPFGIVYFVSGIAGGLLSLYMKVLNNSTIPSIGASGAVFGIDGLLLAMVLLVGNKVPEVTPVKAFVVILFSLYRGFQSSGVDNAGHVGGLVTGFVIGCIVCLILRHKDSKNVGGWV